MSNQRFQRSLYRAYSRYTRTSKFWRQRLTVAGWLILCLMVTSAAVGLNTNETTTYQLFTFLVALFSASILFNLFFRVDITIDRRLPRFATAGVSVTYDVVVRNKQKRPFTALTLSETLPENFPTQDQFLNVVEPEETERNIFDRTFRFYRWTWLAKRCRTAHTSESDLFDLAPDSEQIVPMQLVANRRGVIRLTGMRVGRPDPFGLLKSLRTVNTTEHDTVTVLPKRYPLRNVILEGKSHYQPCGLTLAGSVGQSEEFIGLREYRPGDPIRHLHWRSWARTGIPIVREFEDEFMPRYALVLDTFAPFDVDDVFEEAVSIAASFACTLDTKESLLDLMFVGTEAYCFTSGRGIAQPERLLDILAGVELCRDKPFGDLDILVRSHIRDVSACVCVLIDWDDARRDWVKRLRASGVELVVIVVCPRESTLPATAPEPGVHFMQASRVAEGLAKL